MDSGAQYACSPKRNVFGFLESVDIFLHLLSAAVVLKKGRRYGFNGGETLFGFRESITHLRAEAAQFIQDYVVYLIWQGYLT